ncbi:rab-like protein 6 isoform X2 [Paramormyrops kingsleyae]|uniref:RAB, member RAS onco family like 6 n=1 Tax=Paramormyrops kingsleyae TaxID=1676925 RepID=A0A3B3QT91_9TELE|nr:rab-like protein 6 isoform X2 [Paramormyrops kingsleyae]
MLSALKKLVGSEPGQLKEKNIPAGLQSMNQSLQRRFAKGVQYNMKIVIRGDRNTGKSALWQRLQGRKFLEEYLPTQEIQVTSIHWNYKTTDDVVKVEVWDVVDKGKGKKRGESLKLENEPQESENEMALDAEFLDVYKNCNGIIMMFDITKQWTYNYILRELPKVPNHVPVCVLGNHRDMGEHRVILPDDIRDFIASLSRPLGSSYIHYAESSMKNGFGLKNLHRFFNIPFLQLQRETLLRQLETNQLDMDATLEELMVQQETEDQNYDIFQEMMEARSKGYSSPGPPNGQSPSSGSQSPVVPPSGPSTASSSPGTPQLPVPPPMLRSPSPPPSPPPAPVMASLEPITTAPPPPSQKRGIISRLFGGATPEPPVDKAEAASAAAPPAGVASVDDFVPDERLDRSFLEDNLPTKIKEKLRSAATAADSDSDGEARGGNPMVSGFQDDLDPDDEILTNPLAMAAVPSKDATLSSEEEEEEGSGPPVTRDLDLDSDPDTEGAVMQLPEHSGSAPPTRADRTELGEREDTDAEPPAAPQVLSFVVDDPDLENKEAEEFKMEKKSLPVLKDLSDQSDDELVPARVPDPGKPAVLSIKNKNDDLFGLGFEENISKSKDSSEDQEDKESKHMTKDKKKKKKRSKEEEDKSGKKRHKNKKKEKEESGARDEKERKKKTRSRKGGDLDDLEAFLAGEAMPDKREGGDYEEL